MNPYKSNTRQLDRPGQPQGYSLRQRRAKERAFENLDVPRQYDDHTEGERPTANVDAGERPVPSMGNPRMTVMSVADRMQTPGGTSTEQGLAANPDPARQNMPFSHRTLQGMNQPERSPFPSQSQIHSGNIAKDLRGEKTRAMFAKQRNQRILANPNVSMWRGLMGNDYEG